MFWNGQSVRVTAAAGACFTFPHDDIRRHARARPVPPSVSAPQPPLHARARVRRCRTHPSAAAARRQQEQQRRVKRLVKKRLSTQGAGPARRRVAPSDTWAAMVRARSGERSADPRRRFSGVPEGQQASEAASLNRTCVVCRISSSNRLLPLRDLNASVARRRPRLKGMAAAANGTAKKALRKLRSRARKVRKVRPADKYAIKLQHQQGGAKHQQGGATRTRREQQPRIGGPLPVTAQRSQGQLYGVRASHRTPTGRLRGGPGHFRARHAGQCCGVHTALYHMLPQAVRGCCTRVDATARSWPSLPTPRVDPPLITGQVQPLRALGPEISPIVVPRAPAVGAAAIGPHTNQNPRGGRRGATPQGR